MLTNPQAIMPNTSMPQFFGEDGKSPVEPSYFGGSGEKQINALTKLVIELGGVNTPSKKK